MVRSITKIAVVVLLFAWSGISTAFTVSPLVSSIEPYGGGSGTRMTVRNDYPEPLTVEATAWHTTIDRDGTENQVPADDNDNGDILIFPATVIIQPGATQSFQIRYIGDPEIESSQLYRVKFEQIPVKQDAAEGVTVNFRLSTVVHLLPGGSQPSARVNGVSRLSEENGYLVEIENTGTRYAVLKDSEWHISKSGRSVIIPSEVIKEQLDGNLVLANSIREMKLLSTEAFQGLDLVGADIKIVLDSQTAN